MKMSIRLLFFVVLLMHPFFAIAFETDQFNLPPQELADIGDEITEYTKDNLIKAVDRINAEIVVRQACVEKRSVSRKCKSREKDTERLAYLRSDMAIATELYKLIGRGVPVSTSSRWLETYKFKNQPARFRPKFADSIFVVFPTDYIGLGSTIKVYGAEFGTDKIAHLFQQGYDYLKIYKRELAKGAKPDEALKKAVEWGRQTERTYYGTLISGVFSNGDLASNYAGLKFFLGLTEANRIGDKEIPPILILEKGLWKFNEAADMNEQLLKPYISESFSEAFNPSIYTGLFGLNSYVRRVLKKNCDGWRKRYPDFTEKEFAEKTDQTKLWAGEDYGFRDSGKFVTIANTCFDQMKK